jgi:aerobic-type carbon monoxide dehydrogenase small subunit (CoxS/CutS family)
LIKIKGGINLNKYCFELNGRKASVTCPPTKTLLDVLREDLNLTGSKECCGKGECGSCTVLINGDSVCSCLVLIGQINFDQQIITVEGVGNSENMDVIQQAFVEEGATQCGYCTPGFIVSAHSYLSKVNHVPSHDEIKVALGGNLCRCTGYSKIIKAVETAARKQISVKEA